MRPNKIVTLTTDFGLHDAYVGIMKGVMLTIEPALQLVDLTHQIPPQSIRSAQFQLANSIPYFPPGTVHLAVVDPGVGGNRQAIALQAVPRQSTPNPAALDRLEANNANGTNGANDTCNQMPISSWLVGPNNGIFSRILQQMTVQRAVVLDNPKFWRVPVPSVTFHGRDIFAPAAAHLASGRALEALGQPLPFSDIQQLSLPICRVSPAAISGTIQHVDGFGNLITNISNQQLEQWLCLPSSFIQNSNSTEVTEVTEVTWAVELGSERIVGAATYSSAAEGALVALRGSHGWLEIAVNGGSAEARLRTSPLEPLQVIRL